MPVRKRRKILKKKVIPEKPKAIDLIFLLDRSGSMQFLEKETIQGYNTFLLNQKDTPGEIYVTTVLFDNQLDVLHDRKPIKQVKKITKDQYYARGTTSLNDAIGTTLLNERFKSDTRKIVVIITDGAENSSREFNKAQTRELIEAKQGLGWEFIYLGANVDAFSEASTYGIGTYSNYEATRNSVINTYTVMSSTISDSIVTGKTITNDDLSDIGVKM